MVRIRRCCSPPSPIARRAAFMRLVSAGLHAASWLFHTEAIISSLLDYAITVSNQKFQKIEDLEVCRTGTRPSPRRSSRRSESREKSSKNSSIAAPHRLRKQEARKPGDLTKATAKTALGASAYGPALTVQPAQSVSEDAANCRRAPCFGLRFPLYACLLLR